MSHTYGLLAQIAVRGDEEKKKVVALFSDEEKPFDLPFSDEEECGEDLLLYFKGTTQLTEPSDRWADRLRDCVWWTLGRFARIEVVAEDLESIPTECHSYDEADYDEWVASHDIEVRIENPGEGRKNGHLDQLRLNQLLEDEGLEFDRDEEPEGEKAVLYYVGKLRLSRPALEWATDLRNRVWTELGRFLHIEVNVTYVEQMPPDGFIFGDYEYRTWKKAAEAAEDFRPAIHNIPRTGRTSSAQPNMCGCFDANAAWEELTKSLDFSGIEERVFTPEERAEIEAFDKMTPEERRNAKTRIFGLLYGMSGTKFRTVVAGSPEAYKTAAVEAVAAAHGLQTKTVIADESRSGSWFEEKKTRLKEEIPGVECFESPEDVSYVERIRTCKCDETSRFPGVLFPSDIKGDSSKPWVTKCPECDLFKHDFDAAHFVGRMLDRTVAYAPLGPSQRPYPYIDGITREKAIALGTKAKDR